jgi:hypothetical protein
MRVRALQPCYINDAHQEVGAVFEVADEQFTEGVMEEVGEEAPVTRGAPAARSPSAPLPESGGREKGVETEALEPDLDPEDEPRSGKRKR